MKMQFSRILLMTIFALALCFAVNVFICGTASAAEPVLFFSDLTWGPKTGWENSATKGAAVTVWGKNFGNASAAASLTINGATVPSTDSTYIAEWNVAGPARGLYRITFWIPSTATDGSGVISVTTSEGTSNTLSFNVAAGVIYFIASTGSNSNNGRYATSQGGSNGPFRDLYMFNPGLDSSHTSSNRNPSGDGQYIVYVRGGTYSTADTDSAAIALRGPYGSPTQQKALIAYPGETVWVDTTSLTRGIVWRAVYDPYGKCDYFTFSKINGHTGSAPLGIFGDYNRIVGGEYYGYTTYAQTGDIQVTNSQHAAIYGNYFHDNGNDSMKHGVYVKTEYTGQTGSNDKSTLYTDIGWNEFANYRASDNHGGVIFVSKSGDSQIQQYPTAYTYIHDNYFHNNNQECLYVGDGVAIGDVYFYNNICANSASTTSNGGLTFYNGANNVYVYNNTFYHVAGAHTTEWWATGSTTRVHSRNNIFYASANKGFVLNEGSTGSQINSQYDLFYSSTGAALPSGTGISVANSRSGNPLFVTDGSNFQLQASSPARDSGTSTAVSSVVTKDYDGVARPQNSTYDLGAYEYDTHSPPPTTWVVTASVSGGNGSLSCNSPVVNGNTTTCTASPNNGYYTSSLSGCGGSWSGGNSYTTGAITANCTVIAQFSANPSTYTVGGSISGLSGTVVLRNNGGDNLSRSANGSFTFATALTSGTSYNVTVYTQPSGQTCTVTNGSGTIASSNITNVQVSCVNNGSPTYTVGGTVSGLLGSLTLQNNGANNLQMLTNGSFTFPAQANNSAYSVTVSTQPGGQTCTVSNGSGTVNGSNVTNIGVSCSNNPATRTPSTPTGVNAR